MKKIIVDTLEGSGQCVCREGCSIKRWEHNILSEIRTITRIQVCKVRERKLQALRREQASSVEGRECLHQGGEDRMRWERQLDTGSCPGEAFWILFPMQYSPQPAPTYISSSFSHHSSTKSQLLTSSYSPLLSWGSCQEWHWPPLTPRRGLPSSGRNGRASLAAFRHHTSPPRWELLPGFKCEHKLPPKHRSPLGVNAEG